MSRLFTKFILLFVTILFFITGQALAKDLRIGVLSVRGPDDAVKYWQQVADHLNADIPDQHFVVVPHTYKTMEQAVADRKLEFVVANPAEYIEFEVKYGASRIATQINHVGLRESSSFGTVIFAKANRTDITKLSDLRGKSFAAASKTAFASWVVARDELKRFGISSDDLASLRFTSSSSNDVVLAVKSGEVDAGAVRTFVLEQMAQEGRIALTDFRIINQKHVEGFPFLLSSELYPEFAFARLEHTDSLLANKVAASLMLMPHNILNNQYPNIIGWAVPDSYEKVRKLLQEWKLPPYEDYGKVTLREAIWQHRFIVSLSLLSLMALFLIISISLNIKQRSMKYKGLKEAKQKLEENNELVKEQRDLLTHQKEELEVALAQVKLLEGIIPICPYCKKTRNDQNRWHQLEQ
jgi:ABC-type phosphate/phosphonate transport system substrate-binding protein